MPMVSSSLPPLGHLQRLLPYFRFETGVPLDALDDFGFGADLCVQRIDHAAGPLFDAQLRRPWPRVPNPDRSIIAAGGQPLAVRAEGHTRDHVVAMSLQAECLLTADNVPQFHGSI